MRHLKDGWPQTHIRAAAIVVNVGPKLIDPTPAGAQAVTLTERERLARRLCGAYWRKYGDTSYSDETYWPRNDAQSQAWLVLADDLLPALTLQLLYEAEDLAHTEDADYMYCHIDDAKQYKAAVEHLLGEE